MKHCSKLPGAAPVDDPEGDKTMTLATLDPFVAMNSHRHSPAALSWQGQDWRICHAQVADIASLKEMFRKLHAFNAALDPRFALSEEWESYFDEAIEHALQGTSLCLIAYEADGNRPIGFILGTVHHDSGMWRYREWVEVEALYVEELWRGSGLAETLLDRACDWAESVGQATVQLYVTASNERAIRFYQHEGFGETQAIMRKVLA
jgi:GNAT superfamily N-acetyltransferase